MAVGKNAELWLAIIASVVAVAIAPHIRPQWIVAVAAIVICALYYLIANSRYPAIGIGIIAVLYAADMISLMIFLSTIAIVIMGESAYRICRDEKRKPLAFLAVAVVASFATTFYLGYTLYLVPLTGIIVAAMLKTILKKREDALLLECLGTAMTMLLFEDISYVPRMDLLIFAIIISFAFGIAAYEMRAADLSGLFSAALMGILIIVFSDITWFFVMLTFFILGSAFTKFKYDVKRKQGVAESRGGMRGFLNVYANGMVSLAAAILYGIYDHNLIFAALFLGSVSAAMADTTASELGMLGKRPYLITTFKRVPKGTDGGVTLFGEAAAVIAAIILCAAAYLMGMATPEIAAICVAAGFVGTNIDSLVGATLERGGYIHNTGTNFICTLSGGLFAVLLYILLL